MKELKELKVVMILALLFTTGILFFKFYALAACDTDSNCFNLWRDVENCIIIITGIVIVFSGITLAELKK